MAEPYLRTTWTDPVTARHGYLVIDRLVGGMSGGGTRMREGCTLEEVERLAHAMTLKNGGLDLPVGGAKLGLDMDPHDPAARDMLVRFFRAMRPFFETWVATGEDMGTNQAQLIEAFEEAGIGPTFKAVVNRSPDGPAELARANASFGGAADGIPLFDLVGGYGVTEAAIAAMSHLGWQPRATRAAIQGFGSMGGSTARYLARKGVRVVAIADAGGTIANPDGLDVEHYLAARNEHGEIDRAMLRAGDRELERDDWLRTDADLLVPAAVADTINEGNCDQLRPRAGRGGRQHPDDRRRRAAAGRARRAGDPRLHRQRGHQRLGLVGPARAGRAGCRRRLRQDRRDDAEDGWGDAPAGRGGEDHAPGGGRPGRTGELRPLRREAGRGGVRPPDLFWGGGSCHAGESHSPQNRNSPGFSHGCCTDP